MSKYCPQCGNARSSQDLYCKNCGGSLDEKSRQAQSDRRQAILAFLLICGLAVSVFGAIYFDEIKAGIRQTQNQDEEKILMPSDLASSSPTTASQDLNDLFKNRPQPSAPVDLAASMNQQDIVSTVVNIFCPNIYNSNDISSGSGTIIDSEGIILTNSHVIPQNQYSLEVGAQGCLVTLPDPATGRPQGLYLAQPVVLQGLSDQYDLAFLKIYDAYYDPGSPFVNPYPRDFPSLQGGEFCTGPIVLGEELRIFGYPANSGSYSLTVTDGIVSSLPGDGTIVTSAKISYGNSGGLAVDRNGCMLGVPTMINIDAGGSLGVIVSLDLVKEFFSRAEAYLSTY